jgi:hypothetical protein
MRAVIAIKSTGGSGASRATRYISERDRDPEREGTKPRPLFSDREDTLGYRGADHLLNGGAGTPDKDDLIHIAISFNKEDYERLGPTDAERKEQLREVAREAIAEMRTDLRAKEMRWVAGIHLNTDNPHIHLLIHKEVRDLVTDRTRRVGRIPKELLPYSEARADGGTRPVEGHIGTRFVTALDRHIERAREAVERKVEPERGKPEARSVRKWLRDEVRARDANDSWGARGKVSGESEVRQDRVALGVALEKSLRREYAALDYERALSRGETFRFSARDVSTGTKRQISESDVKRRADARGSRAADEQSLRTSVERQQVRWQVSQQDATLHTSTIGELHKIRGRLIGRLAKELGKANIEHSQADSRAQGVRQKYAGSNQEIPTPIIARDTLNELQERAVSHGLADHVEMLEQLRVTLAREHGQPPRDEREAARLAAQLFTAQTDLRAGSERAGSFEQMRHLQRWEVGGERWSLTDIDRHIEYHSDQARVVGRHHYHLNPRARKEAAREVARLTSVREEVVERINGRRNELNQEADGARKLVEVLTRIHESEAASRSRDGRAMPRPEFIREELHRIEVSAEVTRDAQLLRQLDGFEKLNSERDTQAERVTPEQRLSRAVAREIVAEAAYRESAERLAYYNERGDSQPLALESIDGRISVHRLKDTKPHSLVERALRPLIEKPDARKTRHAIEAASAKSQARLIAENEKSRAYLEAAREIAGNLRAEAREQGIDTTRLAPEFTPKERINLEIYAERQADPTERDRYLSMARGEVARATPLHEAAGGRLAHDHASQFGHSHTPAQSHDYDSHARSTGRAR